MEHWKQKNSKLAFSKFEIFPISNAFKIIFISIFINPKDWNVDGIENIEPELPEYVRKKKLKQLKMKEKSNFIKWCWSWESYVKLFISIMILFSMVTILF